MQKCFSRPDKDRDMAGAMVMHRTKRLAGLVEGQYSFVMPDQVLKVLHREGCDEMRCCSSACFARWAIESRGVHLVSHDFDP